MFKSDSPIAPQTKQILSALVKVILDKELEALTCTDLTFSRRASPLRNTGGGREDGVQVNNTTPMHPPTLEQPQNAGAATSAFRDHGPSDIPDDSTLHSNFDIDMLTGINSLQDSE
jgi:hypothetical protein